MGTKSRKMAKRIADEMEVIGNEFQRCRDLKDYFQDRLAEFLDAPLLSGQRKNLCGQMESVSLQLLPVAQSTIHLIRTAGAANTLLGVFDRFLIAKKTAHQKDWTDLKKRTLQKNLDFVERTKTELEAVRRICNPIPQYVKDALAHCKQA